MTEDQKKQHYKVVKDFTKLPLWRVIILGAVFVIAFNLFWLIPTLDEIEKRALSGQLEVAERAKRELEKIIIDHPHNRINELALYLLPKLSDAAVFETLHEQKAESFFENRDDVIAFSVIGSDGYERMRIARFDSNEPEALSYVAHNEFVKKAFQDDFSIVALHERGERTSAFLVAKRIIVPEIGAVLITATIDLKIIEKFAYQWEQREKENVFIVDDAGFIIDDVNESRIGSSVLQHQFIRNYYDRRGGLESDRGTTGTYVDHTGNKWQATALFSKPLHFAVVAEKEYREIWSSWQRFFLFTLLSLSLFIALIIALIVNTLKMFAVSNQLNEAKEKIETIITNLDTGIVEHDQNFKITLVNPRAEKMLAIKKDDVVGKIITTDSLTDKPNLKSLVYVLYPAICETAKKVKQSKEEDGYGVVEMELVEPVEQSLQITSSAVYDVRKNIKSYLKEIRDVSREKAIARSKSEFISVAAHQLRTPLSAVKWVFKMLLDGDAGAINAEQKDFLQKGYDSNERIIQLVSDMLDAARIEEGRFGFEFYVVSISDVIQKAISLFQVKAKEKNISLIFKKQESTPLIKIDPARIELALQNLIDNALKYTPQNGTITITIESSGNFIKVGIHDTGIGIPKDQADKLFSKFFRGTNAVKFQTEGTGLGLFIVKNIIVRHGGSIWAEANEKGGTTFYFLLPKDEKIIPEKSQSFEEFVEGL